MTKELIKRLRLLAQIDTYGMGDFYIGQVALARHLLKENGLAWSSPRVSQMNITGLFAARPGVEFNYD